MKKLLCKLFNHQLPYPKKFAWNERKHKIICKRCKEIFYITGSDIMMSMLFAEAIRQMNSGL